MVVYNQQTGYFLRTGKTVRGGNHVSVGVEDVLDGL